MYIKCKKCGYRTENEDFFPLSRVDSRTNLQYRKHVCLACIRKREDTQKRPHRARAKARSLLYSHCEKYNRQNGTNYKPSEFGLKFGWDLDRIVHDIEHAFDNWCTYCGHPYSEMGHGLADVTLDIYDREKSWDYGNTRICCATCNKEKGTLSPERWNRLLTEFRKQMDFETNGYASGITPDGQYVMDLVLMNGEKRSRD